MSKPDPKKAKLDVAPDLPLLDQSLTIGTAILFVLHLSTMRHSAGELAEFAAFLLLTLFAIRASKRGFSVIGRAIGTKTALSKPRNLRKFSDQSWQLVIHTTLTVGATVLLHLHDWRWWNIEPSRWENQGSVIPSLKRFYNFQLAVYFYTAFSHRFLEAHHKDYFVMFAHHVSTIVLIMGSGYYNYHRFGLMVMLVHDATDIPADLLKMSNYMGLDGSAGVYLTEFFFVLNLMTWAYGRLYLFPTRLIWSGLFGNVVACASNKTVCDIMRVLLLVLLGMHAWWFALFLRLAYRLLTQDAHTAGREEYEGGSDSDHAKEHTKTN